MTITTISSREFNQDTSGAKKAASKGPVFITDRGKPAHVLLSIEDYQKLTGLQRRHRGPAGDAGSGRYRIRNRTCRDHSSTRGPLLMYLLDTNVISELRKPQADANVVAWAKSVIAPHLFISAITLKELETGVLRMERRDPAQGEGTAHTGSSAM